MKRTLKSKIIHWIRKHTYCSFMNFDYLDRYKEKGNIYDIVRFLGYSSDIQNDVEELINDGYYYAYYCDGEFYHAHSLKSLLVDIAQMIIDNSDVEIVLGDDDCYSSYSQVDCVIIDKFIRKMRKLVKEQK